MGDEVRNAIWIGGLPFACPEWVLRDVLHEACGACPVLEVQPGVRPIRMINRGTFRQAGTPRGTDKGAHFPGRVRWEGFPGIVPSPSPRVVVVWVCFFFEMGSGRKPPEWRSLGRPFVRPVLPRRPRIVPRSCGSRRRSRRRGGVKPWTAFTPKFVDGCCVQDLPTIGLWVRLYLAESMEPT